jgi:HEAT repeat protein
MTTPVDKTSRVVAVTPTQVTTATTSTATLPKPKRGLSTAAKGMIATVLVISIAIMSWVIIDRMGSSRDSEVLHKILTKAAQPTTKEIPVNKKELDILLGSAVDVSLNKDRNVIYKALLLAKSSDNSDIDAIISQFVTTREMLPEVKKMLIAEVLRLRNNPTIVPTLLTFAGSTADANAASSALKAIRAMAEDRHFEPLLKIVQNTTNAEVRAATEATLGEVIRKSSNKNRLADTLALQYGTALNQEIRHCLLRLLGVCGGEKSLATVREILSGSDQQQMIAAIMALGSWGDASGFPALVDFLKESRDPGMRKRAFDAAQKYLGQQKDNPKEEEQWNMLSNQAKTSEEQKNIIQGIANLEGEWPLKLIQAYMKSEDEGVVAKAERALSHMKEMRKLNQ